MDRKDWKEHCDATAHTLYLAEKGIYPETRKNLISPIIRVYQIEVEESSKFCNLKGRSPRYFSK